MSVVHESDMFRLHFVGSAVIFITAVVYWHYSYSNMTVVKTLISGMLGINCGGGL